MAFWALLSTEQVKCKQSTSIYCSLVKACLFFALYWGHVYLLLSSKGMLIFSVPSEGMFIYPTLSMKFMLECRACCTAKFAACAAKPGCLYCKNWPCLVQRLAACTAKCWPHVWARLGSVETEVPEIPKPFCHEFEYKLLSVIGGRIFFYLF